MTSRRSVGAIALVGSGGTEDPRRWQITADPDVVIRLKRILPALRESRAETLYVSDTEPMGRELEWITGRWTFDMTLADRRHLRRQAAADLQREQQVNAIVTGLADPLRDPGWLQPQTPLRGYQQQAVDLVRASRTLLLGDELGGGKTAMALGVLEDPATRPALAVVLTGLGGQWIRELKKFYPELRGYEVRSTKAKEEFGRLCDADGNIAHDLIVMNYAKLASWRHHLAGRIRTVIFDEVQELRRPDSQKYSAAAHVASNAELALGLSATPVYNYGGEIFAIMDGLKQGCLGSRREFMREWCGGAVTHDSDASASMSKVSVDNPDALRAHLSARGLYLHRTLDEMGIDIPGAMTIEQLVPSDTAKYEQLSGNAVEMAKLILAQSTNNTERWRTAAELDWRLRQATGIAKAPFVADFVRMLLSSQQRIVLFGWHRACYDVWLERLKEFDPVLYTGTESAPAKARAVQAFTEGDSRVLIMSLRSGAGLDGLQHHASTLVFGELDWSPGVHRQCIGRLNRDGQSHHVRAYFCVSNDGSDPVMLDTLNIKAMEAQKLTGAPDALGGQPAQAGRVQTQQLARAVLEQAGLSAPAGDQEGQLSISA